MVYDIANSIAATRTLTRIPTFFSDASEIARTLGMYGTFRSTVWWSSRVVFQARTRRHTIYIPTSTVSTTRWRITRILNHRWVNNNRYWKYSIEMGTNKSLRILRLILTHLKNGSPVYPSWQEQIGEWLMTWHSAFNPQFDSHGFIHFWFKHALSCGHSELATHSGLQFGGEPMKVCRQEQTAWSLISLHWLFGPQGEGWHGFVGSS